MGNLDEKNRKYFVRLKKPTKILMSIQRQLSMKIESRWHGGKHI